jgi:hypothetical protein
MLGPACIIIGQSVYIFKACGSLHIPSRPAYDLAACRLSSGRPGLATGQASIYRPALAKIRPGFMQAGRAWPLRNTECKNQTCGSFRRNTGPQLPS